MKLKLLRPYLLLLVTLVTDLLRLCWRVFPQVILPTLRRKGNLLSSLFLLFTGLIERVIGFAEEVVRVPREFQLPARLVPNPVVRVRVEKVLVWGRGYLRQGMLIAAWALFILSSFEWTSATSPGSESVNVEQTAGRPAAIVQYKRVIAASEKPVVFFLNHQPVLCPGPPPPQATQRWLLLRTLRV
jgi:hypothetical protein